ncbi:MAG: hypothetical protein U0744_06860 [Gemmataceae bacterium]
MPTSTISSAATTPTTPHRAAHYIRQAAVVSSTRIKPGLCIATSRPGNLLLERTGVVKILDMGLARSSTKTPMPT